MDSSYQAYGTRQTLPYSNVNTNAAPSRYPPYDASTVSLDRESQDDVSPFQKHDFTKNGEVVVNMREISRTPSPTPSEAAELKKTHFFDLKAMSSWRYWFRKEWIWYYVIGIVATVGAILFTVYHKQIVEWLQPAANWVHGLPAGWLIPIAIFFIISFPPLFGHEILAILCGLVWGLWIGFAIVAAGTFLGELGNFYAFRYCCAARGQKLERTEISYACLARVVREGGFKIALIARFSAIPGHFTTAVFSTCGMSVWTFSIAAILSLPKQFITVYLGVALEQSETGQTNKTDTIIKDVVLAVTVIITFAAMWYIYHRMGKVKPAVIYDRRKARQAKLQRAAGANPYGNTSVLESTTSVAFNPNGSDSDIPLNPKSAGQASSYQQWDSNGRAVGHARDPTLYAPQPQRAAGRMTPASSQASSRSNTAGPTPPVMSERESHRSPPVRQQTQQSATSWDTEVHVGGQEIYHMTRRPSPPSDPFADSERVRQPAQPQSQRYPTPPSMRPGQPPIPTTAMTSPATAPIPHFQTSSQQPTPTQAYFPPYKATPQTAPLPPHRRGISPPLPSQAQTFAHSRAQEPSDASFYTAQGAHSRNGTETYTAYDNVTEIAPPSYRSMSPPMR